MKTIHLVLKYRWFDMIASGEKIEDYREIKPYYEGLKNLKWGDVIIFHRGYTKVRIGAEVRYCYKSFGISFWGGDLHKIQWVIGFRLI